MIAFVTIHRMFELSNHSQHGDISAVSIYTKITGKVVLSVYKQEHLK